MPLQVSRRSFCHILNNHLASLAPFSLGFNPADIPEGEGIDIPIPPPMLRWSYLLDRRVGEICFILIHSFLVSASGKSSLFRRVFQPCGYEHVNLDTLRTQDKCAKVPLSFP